MKPTTLLATAAAALVALAGCATPPPASHAANPVPVEGATYRMRHESWPPGHDMRVVYRGGRFLPAD